MTGRTIWIVCVLLSIAALCACDLDDRSERLVFFSSGTPSATDRVRLVGTSLGTDRFRVGVVIDGWTESSDVFAFNFGLVVEPQGALEIIQGSLDIGTALEESGCADPIGLASPQPTGVTVGVTKIGPCDGQTIGPDEQTIVSLEMRLVGEQATLRFGASGPNDPSALDSFVQPIPTITFDPAPSSVAAW